MYPPGQERPSTATKTDSPPPLPAKTASKFSMILLASGTLQHSSSGCQRRPATVLVFSMRTGSEGRKTPILPGSPRRIWMRTTFNALFPSKLRRFRGCRLKPTALVNFWYLCILVVKYRESGLSALREQWLFDNHPSKGCGNIS